VGFIRRYRPGVTPQTHPKLDALVGYAINYFRDFVLPEKRFREPGAVERAALLDLRDALSQLPADATAEQIQEVVYEIGRREPFLDKTGKGKTADGKPGVALDWFNMLYQVCSAGERPALRLVRGGLRAQEHHRHDRRGARAVGVATRHRPRRRRSWAGAEPAPPQTPRAVGQASSG
jgi:hypothetical protein